MNPGLRPKKREAGFTLIEIMTSVSIFAVVMTISMGSILGVFETNKKSESIRAVMDNLNLALESMSREMRFGTNYNDGAPCSNGCHSIAFEANNGDRIIYQQTGTAIEKSVAGGAFIPVTAEEIRIDDLSFYVLGVLPSDEEGGEPKQPKVLVKIKGTAGVKADESDRTDFTVQTLVSQRLLDQ